MIGIGILEGSLLSTFTVGAFLAICAAVALCPESPRSKFSVFLYKVFVVSFMIRVVVTFCTHLWLVQAVPDPFWHWGGDVGGDEYNFFHFSEKWVNVFLSGNYWTEPDPYHSDYLAWIYSLGFIRYIGVVLDGDTIFNTKLLSCFYSALVVPFIYLLAKKLLNKTTAYRAALVACFLPDYLWLGSSIARDTMISCLIAVVIYQAVMITRKGGFRFWRCFVILLLIFFVLPHLKTWLSIMLVMLMTAWWFWERSSERIYVRGAMVLLFLTLLVPLIMTELGNALIQLFLYSGESIGMAQRLATERLGGIEGAGPGSLGAKILSLPVYIYVPVNMVQQLVFIPPWGGINAFGFVPRAIAETVVMFSWIWLAAFVPAGTLNCLRRQYRDRSIWIWGTALVLIFFLALASAVRLRWRLMAMPFLVIIIAHGMMSARYRWTVIYSAIGVVTLLVTYAFLKILI